jgi:DNA (cytosine-5)-methyltransferase 1
MTRSENKVFGKPRMLDLFCGAGGATRGYQLAGFHVTGIDIKAQPRYCGDDFIQTDAMNGALLSLKSFDAIHASPPCQRYTALRGREDLSGYPDYIAGLRELLDLSGLPYVIENVEGSPLRPAMVLCGASFGLRVYRHRWFEVSPGISVEPALHQVHAMRVNRRGENRKEHWANGGFMTVTGDVGSYVGPEGMGIDWMTGDELREAIPPAYTEFVGIQLLAAIRKDVAA